MDRWSMRLDGRWCSFGQSTLEYALVLMAFLSMLIAFGALWEASRSGRLVELAQTSSGHSLDGGLSAELLQDLGSF